MFVVKKDLNDLSVWEYEVYPVAYFEEGLPWFSTPASSKLRKPSGSEQFWGTLVSPGQNSAGAWNELKATRRAYLERVREGLRDFLAQEAADGRKVTRRDLEDFGTDSFSAVAVQAVLRDPDFQVSHDQSTGVSYYSLFERI
jgi:hypothetical protein